MMTWFFAEIAALIHDIGHSSWGHGLEPLCSLLPFAREDKRFDKIRLFGYLSDKNNPLYIAINYLPNISVKELLAFFRNPETLRGNKIFLNDLIDSEADMDRIDYLNRDAYHANGPVGIVDQNTLAENAHALKVGSTSKPGYKLVYAPEAAQTLHNLLDLRDAMYAHVYENDIKTAAEEMLCHAVYAFYKSYSLDEDDLEQLLRLSDGDLISLIRLFGHEYEAEMVHRILSRDISFVVKHFLVQSSPKPGTFNERLYELARQLKSVGFEEKVRIEKRLCKDYFSLEGEFPSIFIRPPEILSVKKTAKEEIRIEESKSPTILYNDKPVLLKDYLGVLSSVSPELKNLRIYAPSTMKDRETRLIEGFRTFVEERAWKP